MQRTEDNRILNSFNQKRTLRMTKGRNLCKLNSKGWRLIELLCATAKKGLTECYSGWELCGQHADLGRGKRPTGLHMSLNLRYVMITQIGIKRWTRFHECDKTLLPDFQKYICSKQGQINDAGDLGLAIWASVESRAEDCTVFLKKLVDNWSRIRWSCNAVELAWVVQGIVRFSQDRPVTDELNGVLKDAHSRLMVLHGHDTGLFARHNRRGLKAVISRRIASFADQMYSILALVSYGRYFDDEQSINAAMSVADTICRLQGPNGQWWWHYDAKTGMVAEEYPVFSVHQDAMAPMALLAIDKVANTNHSSYIEKGLTWLNGQNELRETMVLPEVGIIYRDIHRMEISKMYRFTRGLLITAGCNTVHRLAGTNLFGYVVNRVCRPYHLGWILYAWADSL
jgi:hypothetical protein